MTTIELKAQPLTRESFQPYGDVIETEGASHFSINAGTVERFHDLATVSIDTEAGGRPLISIAKANVATSLPARINLVERHPHASQAFIPMFDTPMIVVVAPAGETVEPQQLRAFVSNGKQGVNYHPGTWHMPLIASAVGDQLLIVDRGGPGENYDELLFNDHDIVVGV